MRTKKRLRWVREENANGMSVYRSKRKTESAIIVPKPEGGYDLVYRSQKCKRKAVVGTITEAKETAEALRTASSQRNPLAPSRSTKLIFIGAGLGAAAVAAAWWMNKNAAAAATVAPAPAQPPSTGTPASAQIYITLHGPGSQSTSWNGGTLFVDLPSGAQSWTSVGTDVSVANTTTSIQLPTNPVGTYTFGYVDSSYAHQTATLTVTAGPAAPTAGA